MHICFASTVVGIGTTQEWGSGSGQGVPFAATFTHVFAQRQRCWLDINCVCQMWQTTTTKLGHAYKKKAIRNQQPLGLSHVIAPHNVNEKSMMHSGTSTCVPSNCYYSCCKKIKDLFKTFSTFLLKILKINFPTIFRSWQFKM